MFKTLKPKSESNNVDQTLFVMFDSKIGKYELPMMAMNKLDMIRQIENLFKSPDSNKSKYFTNAEDFSLFQCATYNRDTGLVDSDNLVHVANMHDIKAYCQVQ